MELYRVEIRKYKDEYYNEFTWRDGDLELEQMIWEVWNDTDTLFKQYIEMAETAFREYKLEKKKG